MSIAEPRTRRWNREEYYRMADEGLFTDQRVELMDGEIVVMPPQKNFHAISFSLALDALRSSFGPGYWIRAQLPLSASPFSEPEPDIAVVAGEPRDYTDHPTSALLVVEVSDTTLKYDRGKKASLYAQAGILEYWIIDLVHDQVEVHRKPAPDQALPFGWGYSEITIRAETDSLTPLAAPNANILVGDLLP